MDSNDSSDTEYSKKSSRSKNIKKDRSNSQSKRYSTKSSPKNKTIQIYVSDEDYNHKKVKDSAKNKKKHIQSRYSSEERNINLKNSKKKRNLSGSDSEILTGRSKHNEEVQHSHYDKNVERESRKKREVSNDEDISPNPKRTRKSERNEEKYEVDLSKDIKRKNKINNQDSNKSLTKSQRNKKSSSFEFENEHLLKRSDQKKEDLNKTNKEIYENEYAKRKSKKKAIDGFRKESKKRRERENSYDNSEFEKERSYSPNGDESGRHSKKLIKYENYYSGGVSIRKNSDNYWNKYPLKEDSFKSSERHEVGPRYYNVPNKDNQKGISKNIENENKKEKQSEIKENKEENPIEKTTPAKKTVDMLTSKTGGAYIPPAKLRMMQESITDKSSAAYQRLAWEALKKSIQGLVNKINISNIVPIVKELQRENIVRGRGLLCRAIIQAQASSPTFTHVYAALVSAINTKFPNVGELLLKRLIVQFRRGFKRNDKTICITAATFIAHLVNQQVAHEILALEILTLLIESPTNDSVEVAIAFLKECGMKLSEVSKKGIAAVFDMLRNILHEGKLEKRVQYMIEVMFQIRKDDFKAYPSIVEGLNLVYDEDQFMHLVTLEEEIDTQDILNVFKFDPEYEVNEAKYKTLVVEDSDEEGSSESGDSDDEDNSDEESEDEETGEKKSVIIDRTETNLVALRRTIYLTIQSSLDFEECAHKLLRMQIKPGQEIEMCHMFLDCCAEQRTYEKFYGLLAQRFCQINRTYIAPFEETFRDSYSTIHRIETDKLRNIAKLFAHLLFTDAISWEVLATIRLNEDDTTSSSRIFIKILFLELSEYMGLAKLNQRVKDPTLQTAMEGLFPRDNPKNTRFAINFFTSIGLGGLTDELREHLKTQPKPTATVPQLVEALSSSSSDSSSSDSSSSDSSSDSSSSDTSSESDESTPERKSKKKSKTKPTKNKTKEKSQITKKSSKVSSSKKKKPNR